MKGKRKFFGYIFTSILIAAGYFYGMSQLSSLMDATGQNVVYITQVFIIAEMITAAAFFGFNLGEHFANLKLNK